ncbi:M48 family metallopeptidase [Sphingomonas baiyangensis]|uniref:M48 family metallopeptidase n=1 Tax=Sphingomonas baiyangensis TaxID=2572576 RepID=A0A4U1L5U1_9SPHN|nr:M48 family metallopeptidase [Sphingomonas baiyangensis]
MRLSVDPASGEVRLTLPPRVRVERGLAWAREKQGWIAAQRATLPAAIPFVPGTKLPVDDRDVVIEWAPDHPRAPARIGDRLCCGGPAERLPARIEAWLKREARAVLEADTQAAALRAGVTVSSVGIGDPRSRWGSCAASGAIRYSWRLLLAPRFVRQATVAHEVAHRLHMHHGPAFHAAVAEILGSDPAPAMAWLRRHGAGLHWFGKSPG